MTTTTDRKSKRTQKDTETTEQPTARQAAVLRPTQSRRRPVLIALGVALALLGGVGVWWVTTNLTRTVSVMATDTDIARGVTPPLDRSTARRRSARTRSNSRRWPARDPLPPTHAARCTLHAALSVR